MAPKKPGRNTKANKLQETHKHALSRQPKPARKKRRVAVAGVRILLALRTSTSSPASTSPSFLHLPSSVPLKRGHPTSPVRDSFRLCSLLFEIWRLVGFWHLVYRFSCYVVSVRVGGKIPRADHLLRQSAGPPTPKPTTSSPTV